MSEITNQEVPVVCINNIEIDNMITSLNHLSSVINKGLEKINTLPAGTKETYRAQLTPLIIDFQALTEELTVKLREYIIKERQENLPINFTYRKCYSNLIKSVVG